MLRKLPGGLGVLPAAREPCAVSVVGRTYLERGQRVLVLVQWRTGPQARGTVRNVLIRRETGELVVRPFRGLRKP